jgi:hypothetical protein
MLGIFLREPQAQQSQDKERQNFRGPTVRTKDLHNVSCPSGTDDEKNFANSCFHRYTLTVDAPPNWTFIGAPWVNLVEDNDGSFAWNGYPPPPDRFFVTESTSNSKKAIIWLGSHPITVQLACVAVRND